MISVEQALTLIREQIDILPAIRCAIEETAGLVLAQPLDCRLNIPPHDKAMMDGYAFRHNDCADGKQLKVIGRITAGEVPEASLLQDTAIQIMTGASIPDGADCVEMFERCQELNEAGARHTNRDALPSAVRVTEPVRVDQNIMRKGQIMRAGQQLLDAGHLLTPVDIGLAIDSGISNAAVTPMPRIAVLATGNELLNAGEEIVAGRIFNSNGPMISAMVRQAGLDVSNMGIARDDQQSLRESIERGLEHDVLILTGGVSAGVLDLVPAELEAAGVNQVFHKVQLKPGKPVWFGVKHHEPQNRTTLVFGLPGNPVSCVVCFHLFVKPALRWLAGRSSAQRTTSAQLVTDHLQRGDRATYWPATVSARQDNPTTITPLQWKGSSDLQTLATANSLALFPAGDRQFHRGDDIQYVSFE